MSTESHILISNNKILKILDLGCSTGNLLEKLSNIFPNYHLAGMDKSQSMVEMAKKKKISADIWQGDILQTRLKEYDVIILSLVLQFKQFDLILNAIDLL